MSFPYCEIEISVTVTRRITQAAGRRLDMRLDTSFANHPSRILSGKGLPGDRTRAGTRGSSGRPHAALQVDATASLRTLCASVTGASLAADRLPTTDELDGIRVAADKLAGLGVSLSESQRAVHVAVSAGLKDSVGQSASEGTEVIDRAVFMMRVLELLGTVVSSAYIDQCRLDSGQARERVSRLVEMLQSDDPDALVVAERSGIEIAAEYDVFVVHFGGSDPADVDAGIVEAALDSLEGGRGRLASLSGHGGIVLMPSADAAAVNACFAELCAVVGGEVVAATARACMGEIGAAATHCRELLELARSLEMEARLYRTGDLALEFQLSRPGPGRSRLRAVIAPLESFPELLNTLKTFIASEANRRASAKTLYVHPNTVDYRLKRVEQLTGVDPLSSAGLMSLHAALVVDSLARSRGAKNPAAQSIAAAS